MRKVQTIVLDVEYDDKYFDDPSSWYWPRPDQFDLKDIVIKHLRSGEVREI